MQQRSLPAVKIDPGVAVAFCHLGKLTASDLSSTTSNSPKASRTLPLSGAFA
jgi:hypothetical protein